MHDSYTGCVSGALTSEEIPAAYVSITPSLLLCCMKNGKHCDSIPLNLTPTQILSAWFSWFYPAGGKQGGGGQRNTALVLKRAQS